MTVLSEPLLNPDLVVLQAGGNKALGSAAVGVGGSGGNLMLAPEAVPKIGVRAANVFAKGVATSRLIKRKVAASGVRVSAGFFGFALRLLGLRIT